MQLHVPGVRSGRDFGGKRSNGAIRVLWCSVLREWSPAFMASRHKSEPGYAHVVSLAQAPMPSTSALPRRASSSFVSGPAAFQAGRVVGVRRSGGTPPMKAAESHGPPPTRDGFPVALRQGGRTLGTLCGFIPGRSGRLGWIPVPLQLLVAVRVSSTTCVQQQVGPCRALVVSAQCQTADNEPRSRHRGTDRTTDAAPRRLSGSFGPTAAGGKPQHLFDLEKSIRGVTRALRPGAGVVRPISVKQSCDR
jgi:hypothetical protein